MSASLDSIGKFLIISGGCLIALGLAIILLNKTPFNGKLPGDILIKKENFTFYFPLATSIVLSIIISLIIFLFQKFR